MRCCWSTLRSVSEPTVWAKAPPARVKLHKVAMRERRAIIGGSSKAALDRPLGGDRSTGSPVIPLDRLMLLFFSQLGAHLPQFGEETDVERTAQIGDARGAAGAAVAPDDALDGGDVAETPLLEPVLEV